jgi:peptide/nickel transport system permease protein
MIPVIIGISIVVFLMLHLIPGDPALMMLGSKATPQAIAQLHVRLGLDKPIVVQYLSFLFNLLKGNFGDSYFYNQPVLPLILSRLAPTLFLVAYSAVLLAFISVPLAILTALHRNSWIDQLVRGFSVLTLGMPTFWLGILLLMVFSLKMRLFPVSGWGEGFFGHLYSLFLPALTISLGISAIMIRSLRSTILETLLADYIRTARAKGLPKEIVFIKHALRTSLIPAVTLFGLNIGYLIGGTVLVETVFSIPGIGLLLISTIFTRDYPMVQGITMILGFLVLLINLITDITYSFLDPRVSLK